MVRSAHPTARQVVHGYLVLPHAVPVIVVMTATAAFALLAAGGWPGHLRMACLLGAMFGGQVAIGATNDLVDAALDATAKPSKPIPSGLVSKRGALIVAAGGIILMIACSLRFSLLTLGLCAAGTGTGIAYSFVFKRTVWSWVPYLVALPLLPIWVWTALSSVPAGIFAIYPIGAPAVIAVQLAQSLPDVAADRAAGVRTLAVTLGERNARLACWGAVVLATVLAAVLAPPLTHHPVRLWAAAVVALLLVMANIVIWLRNPRRGVLACFPCVAVAVAALGIGWGAALVSLQSL
jgi:4-hydroxybenzoate polyprenyltransferase